MVNSLNVIRFLQVLFSDCAADQGPHSFSIFKFKTFLQTFKDLFTTFADTLHNNNIATTGLAGEFRASSTQKKKLTNDAVW